MFIVFVVVSFLVAGAGGRAEKKGELAVRKLTRGCMPRRCASGIDHNSSSNSEELFKVAAVISHRASRYRCNGTMWWGR